MCIGEVKGFEQRKMQVEYCEKIPSGMPSSPSFLREMRKKNTPHIT